MDQAASVISTLNSALYISFYPTLSALPIKLPTDLTDPPAVFVIANSLVVSDKAVSAKTLYNLRVVETLVGARILANDLGVKIGRVEKVTFREVLGRWISGDEKGSGKEIEVEKLRDGLEKILDELEGLKPPPEKVMDGQLGVTMEEMINLSGLSDSEFRQLYLSWVEGRCSSPVSWGFYPDPQISKSKQPTSTSTIARNTYSQKLFEFFNSATYALDPNLLLIRYRLKKHSRRSEILWTNRTSPVQNCFVVHVQNLTN